MQNVCDPPPLPGLDSVTFTHFKLISWHDCLPPSLTTCLLHTHRKCFSSIELLQEVETSSFNAPFSLNSRCPLSDMEGQTGISSVSGAEEEELVMGERLPGFLRGWWMDERSWQCQQKDHLFHRLVMDETSGRSDLLGLLRTSVILKDKSGNYPVILSI